jgi:minor histocompatibility antigen H13
MATTAGATPAIAPIKTVTLYPEYERYCWIALAAVQLLPFFVAVPLGVQLLTNSTVVVLLGVLKSVDVYQSDPDKEVDEPSKRIDADAVDGQSDHVKTKDALMFPITASCSLLVLYILFSYINKDLIKSLLRIYFSYLGMYTLGLFIAEKLIEKDHTLTEITFEKDYGWKIPYIMDEPLKITMRKADNYGFAISFVFAAVYCLTSHWLLNNIFGIAFTIGGIRLIKLGNFKIGFIMLWGLFIYDIFWVFKTDVMVTVAKSVDGPILLKFPINLAENKFSMLGLGDMIVPGAFISLLLKFDVDSYLQAFPKARARQIRTPFMWYNILFYFIGILTTYIFMTVFNHAQPALLYLVPAATIGFAIPAFLRGGNYQDLIQYEAVEEAAPAEEKKAQ